MSTFFRSELKICEFADDIFCRKAVCYRQLSSIQAFGWYQLIHYEEQGPLFGCAGSAGNCRKATLTRARGSAILPPGCQAALRGFYSSDLVISQRPKSTGFIGAKTRYYCPGDGGQRSGRFCKSAAFKKENSAQKAGYPPGHRSARYPSRFRPTIPHMARPRT